MREAIKPLDRNRLSVLVAVLLLGSALFRLIELPNQTFKAELLGSPLEIQVTGAWLLITVVVGLVCTGTNLVLQDHPHLHQHPGRPIYVSWILPGLMAGYSAYLLAHAVPLLIWLVGLTVIGVGISLVVSAEYTAVCPDARAYPTARLALNVLAYLLAFALFLTVYYSRSRSLVTASLVLLAAGLLALDLLSVAEVPLRRSLSYAGIVAIIVGQSTWALNYWQISAWEGGLLLLLIFYVAVNVAHQHLLDRLEVSILIELFVVAVVVLLAVWLRTS